MYLDGRGKAGAGADLLGCFAKADSTAALTWATFFGCVLAVALPLCRCARPGVPFMPNTVQRSGTWPEIAPPTERCIAFRHIGEL